MSEAHQLPGAHLYKVHTCPPQDAGPDGAALEQKATAYLESTPIFWDFAVTQQSASATILDEMKPEAPSDFAKYLPKEIGDVRNHQKALPRIAKDPAATSAIQQAVRGIRTEHKLHMADSRTMSALASESVHLVLTSPPYWTLKQYRDGPGQMGHIADYEEFLKELDHVWEHCFRTLVPGGRLICVVGDVCLSRRKNKGRHTVVPLHASIQERCRNIGFDNLAPIIWNKIANAAYESGRGTGGFLGKPYEPGAVIKNDIEFILMQRKPGGYRSPSVPVRILSVISEENHRKWFQQIWTDVTGASTREHPAPFPLELAERLVRMFSFVGDTVLDPFMGTATTNLAAARWGRNSIGVEVDEHYYKMATRRLDEELNDLFSHAEVSAGSADIPKRRKKKKGTST